MKKRTWFSLLCLISFLGLVWGSGSLAQEEVSPKRVEIKGDWFYVDGDRYLVKGVGYSPWRPNELPWKNPVPLDRMEADFKKIKAAGFNTLRTWTPLSPEALQLANEYSLMVIQGIYLNQSTDYKSENYLQYCIDKVKKEIRFFKDQPNVLMVLVANEPPIEKVVKSGLKVTEQFLEEIVEAAKKEAPHIPISFSNWTQLSFLDTSYADCAAFNVYMSKPVTIRSATGYLPFLRWLKSNHAEKKPMVVTEFGLAVNPSGDGGFSEFGNSLSEQSRGLIYMWRQVLASGAAGGCVFEWNDEWWKNYEVPGDENKHDDDSEEWYGLINIDNDPLGEPRPSYYALKEFNQAIVVSPNRFEDYVGKVPFSINTVESVKKVQIKIGDLDWKDLLSKEKKWWEGRWNGGANPSEKISYKIRAFDENNNIVSEKEDFFFIVKEAVEKEELKLSIAFDPPSEQIKIKKGETLTLDVTFQLLNSKGEPVPGQRIFFSFYEVLYDETLKGKRKTDAEGKVHIKYIVQQPGFLLVAAGSGFFSGERVARVADLKGIEILRTKESAVAVKLPTPDFTLANQGTQFPVNYEDFGRFEGVGTKDFEYIIRDFDGLAAAVGVGIYPDEFTIYKEPLYRSYKKSGKLDGLHWDFVAEQDKAASFLKWCIAPEDPFVKQFYAAAALMQGNVLQHAIKSFYAIVVHQPGGMGWTYFGTPWSLGKTALDRIDWMTRKYPELGIRLDGASIKIKNGFDNDVTNDEVSCNPGQFVKVDPSEVIPPKRNFKETPIIKALGGERTTLNQHETGDWELLVDGEPYMIKGITYVPVKVGNSPHEGTMEDWMLLDTNNNGKADGPYDAWVDKNLNNKQDADEPVVGDFQLMKEMGVNTVRMYHHASDKEVLKDLYENYGIRVMIGDFIGMYNVGSGAKWEDGTDYRDPQQQENMLESVRQMVLKHKDEDYVVFWVLGNENNYGGVEGDVGGKGNAALYPDAYYTFVNRAAKLIKELDPTRPVALCNGDVYLLDVVAKYAPEVDIYGMNTYRGPYGFGRSLWLDIKQTFDRPVLVTEYGCPAFHPGKSLKEAELEQTESNRESWLDMEYNSAGTGIGNSIGGILFQFTDGWWKSGQPPTFSPFIHETLGQFPGPFPAGWFYEEWFGITGQGNGQHSPFMRQLRDSYFMFQELWTKDAR